MGLLFMRNEDTITLQEVINVLGQPRTKISGEYVWMCPYCKDSHKDNMRFNAEKGLLWCFAEPEHSKEIVKEIYSKRKNENYSSNYVPKKVEIKNTIPKWELNKNEYLEYMLITNDILVNDENLLEYLYKKRGLRKNTLELVGWGFDNTENFFVIPIFSLKYDCIIDFEVREKCQEKKIRRLGGGCSTIAQIYGCMKAKTLYITEGMIDGAVLLQWLLEKNQKDFTIYSCSHGVSSLYNCLNEICFSNFKEIKLILDNDSEGDKWSEKIVENYPFIQDKRGFLKEKSINDICDYYNKFVLTNYTKV